MPQTITVNVVSSVSTGPSSGYFVIPGNLSSMFFPGFTFMMFNGTEELPYTVVSSSFAAGNTQVVVNSTVFGSVITLGAFTPGTGPFITGTYFPIPVTGGHGSGAQLQVVVSGLGPINSLGLITPGTLYTNGTYTAVPLTGGTGHSALATVVVSGGFVAQVFITTSGTGYTVGDVLSASNTDLGGTGSGFHAPVATTLAAITAVTLVTAGVGYQAGDTLTFGGLGYGTGDTVLVSTVTSTELGSIVLQNTQPMFNVGQQVFVINAGNASCQTPWWSMLPTTTPIPAVQPATVLQITVLYSNSTPSVTITYAVRLGSQPGTVNIDQSMVFVDLPTAIAAYEAELAA